MTEIARALDAFEALIFDINCLAPPLHPGRNRIRRMRKVLAEARKALLAIASNDSFTKDEAPGRVPGAPGAARHGVQPATSTIAAPEDTPRESAATNFCSGDDECRNPPGNEHHAITCPKFRHR